MKGRKPKPAAIRKLEGTLTPKHQAKNIINIDAMTQVPKPPNDLGPDGVDFWETWADGLVHIGIMTRFDVPAFTLLCESYERYKRAQRELGSELIAETPQGSKQHPLFAVMHREETVIERLMKEFGLTPVARERIAADGKGESDELDEIIKRAG